jgi:hypothetical protein
VVRKRPSCTSKCPLRILPLKPKLKRGLKGKRRKTASKRKCRRWKRELPKKLTRNKMKLWPKQRHKTGLPMNWITF